MWDLPGPRLEPVSPALAGGFLSIAPREVPDLVYVLIFYEVNSLSLLFVVIFSYCLFFSYAFRMI